MYGEKQLERLLKHTQQDKELLISLQNDFQLFTSVFFKKLTGRDFIIPNPIGIVNHVTQICHALERVHKGECKRLRIHVPPRSGKSHLMAAFIAWAYSINPKCNFIYTSYGHELASKLVGNIRDHLTLPEYRQLFGIELLENTKTKIKTEDGGELIGSGTGGFILGHGAGIRGAKDYFSGCFIIDDAQNPDKMYISEKESNEILDWFVMKALPRLNNPDIPVILICQRLGTRDLPGRLDEISKPGEWEEIVIPALYDNDTKSFYESEYPVATLLDYKNRFPFMFYSMFQQQPINEGLSLFKPDSFEIKNEEPEILFTFITADTAETSKTYNDPTVFSFWGVYKVKNIPDTYALHWLDCAQFHVEPKDLEREFFSFYKRCCFHKKNPSFVAIEKKSTGTTLLSTLKSYQGIEIIDIERTRATTSLDYKFVQKMFRDKISRFISMQPYINRRLISFTKYASHIQMCIDHLSKINAEGSYAHDDIADTLFDAINLCLIDKATISRFIKPNDTAEVSQLTASLVSDIARINSLRLGVR